MHSVSFGWWALLAASIASLLTIDLFAHRGERPPSRGAALGWSIFWISAAALFGVAVTLGLGRDAGEEYFSAWLLEKSLSVDNLLLFLLVFQSVGLKEAEQRRVLSWGVLGALAARGVFIATGSAALERWHGLVYVLGALLLVLGVKMLWPQGESNTAQRLLGWLKRRLPLTGAVEGNRFLVRRSGRWLGTPLLLALLAVELTDVVFAIDSIPAAFSVSDSPFIVYASNLFAVLGLRALYVVLSGALAGLRFLKHGLAVVLCFGGVKLAAPPVVEVTPGVSLLVIATVLAVAIVASLVSASSCSRRPEPPPGPRALPSPRAP